MPSKDTYGSQAPLELLRTWLDHGYWSDLVDTTKIELVDMVGEVCQLTTYSVHKLAISYL